MDTAWTYHSGNSERVLGRALRDGYRDRVKVATKLPIGLVQTPRDFDRFLNEQLERLQTEHIDFYLLRALRRDRWTKVRDMGVIEWAEGAISDGRIGHLGFSFHDDYDAFREILDSYDRWTLCQIQYNYINESAQAGTKGLEYAARKGVAVVVMEPLLGGGLVRQPETILEIWKSAGNPRSPAEWALQWVWNKPEVSVVLSGMNAMEQVIENIAGAESSGTNNLSDAAGAEACVQCRECEDKCPQNIIISEWMTKLAREFTT